MEEYRVSHISRHTLAFQAKIDMFFSLVDSFHMKSLSFFGKMALNFESAISDKLFSVFLVTDN